MIIRIVKMPLSESAMDAFKSYIPSFQEQLRKVDGCLHHDIFEDKHNELIYYSYTIWESDKQLASYRKTPLFSEIAGKLKEWCAKEPQAWTVDNVFDNPNFYGKF